MHGEPILIREGSEPLSLKKLPLTGEGSFYDEEFIQKMVFENPQCLPVASVDRAYENFVPVCMELNTQAGPLDALFVTDSGRLIILEAKLWRNPEARRKVVAQILDYAKELSKWDYEDLQREVSRNLGIKGNVLFERVKEKFPDLDEAEFVDEVQVSLRRGRFLLLILGDGIREGAGSIADFLQTVGNLEFTFGLVEVGLFQDPEYGLIVFPNVVTRTVELKRVIVQIPEDAKLVEPAEVSREIQLTESQEFYMSFWSEFLSELELDDTSQPLANKTKSQNVYFTMPPSGQISWVSAYFSGSSGDVGVYIRFSQSLGEKIYRNLEIVRDEIDKDLGLQAKWETRSNGIHSVSHRIPISDVFDDKNRDQIKTYFAETVNQFVNAFRHRIERILDEISE